MAQLSFWDEPEPECDPGDQEDFTDILARSDQQYDPRFEYTEKGPQWIDPCQKRRWLNLRKRLLKAQNYLCYYCEIKIELGQMHIDHKQSVSRKGMHLYSNLCATCKTCNLSKNNLTEAEYRGEFMPAPTPKVVKESRRFHSGQRVRHSKFGDGLVILAVSRNGDDEVDVKFDNIKQVKRLSASMAGLKVINDE